MNPVQEFLHTIGGVAIHGVVQLVTAFLYIFHRITIDVPANKKASVRIEVSQQKVGRETATG